MNASMIGSSPTNQAILDILFYLAIIIVIAAALVALGVWLSRKLREENQTRTPETGFTLADLKRMHREGRINDEEFERARQKWIQTQQESAGLTSSKASQSSQPTDAAGLDTVPEGEVPRDIPEPPKPPTDKSNDTPHPDSGDSEDDTPNGRADR